MNYKQRHLVYFFIGCIEVALIVGCYFASSFAYVGTLLAFGNIDLGPDPLWRNLGIAVVTFYSACLVVAYTLRGVYGCVYLGQIREMAKRVIGINTVGIILFAAMLYMLHFNDASRMTLLIFYLSSTFTVVFANWIAIQVFYRIRKSGRSRRDVLVVGSGHLAGEYAGAIGTRSSRLEHIIGYVDPHIVSVHEDPHPLLRECLGSISDLDAICEARHIDEIVIALDAEEYTAVKRAMAAADKYGTALTLIPFYNDVMPRRPDIDSVGGVNLINMRSMPLSSPMWAVAKRTTDIVVSLFVILLTSWLMIITAIGVKLSSPGPVFFKQTRVGRFNRPFEMLKFRSMRNAEGAVSTFTENKDERKTIFGGIICKFSIDELPQFFNVLKGDMSIVGPRPLVEEEISTYREDIQSYMLRHQVRPGITGLAQVKGYRGGTEAESIKKRTDLDLWYIEHWTYGLDVKIFLKTLFGGFINDEKIS